MRHDGARRPLTRGRLGNRRATRAADGANRTRIVMIDEAFERQSFASVLEQHHAERYAQLMRGADSAKRAIAILKAFAQSRGEVLSVAHEDRPPEQMCTAHLSSGEISNSMGSQGAAIAAIATWLNRD
jgi:hypothetical protein